ncbi:hypothetical protein ACTXT7_001856 [Hymenolepis weldensis]
MIDFDEIRDLDEGWWIRKPSICGVESNHKSAIYIPNLEGKVKRSNEKLVDADYSRPPTLLSLHHTRPSPHPFSDSFIPHEKRGEGGGR